MRKKKGRNKNWKIKITKMHSDVRLLQSFSPHRKVKFNVALSNDF